MSRNRQRRRPTAETHTTTTAPEPHLTLADLRHALPVRPIIGPHSALDLTIARAILASATARLPIPIINWQALPDGRAGAYMRDDTLIVHTAPRAPHFLALIPCPHPAGGRHPHTITDLRTLAEARNLTAACDGPPTVPTPNVHPLHHKPAITDDTQEFPLPDIAATLPIHTITADDHQPKEHPQP